MLFFLLGFAEGMGGCAALSWVRVDICAFVIGRRCVNGPRLSPLMSGKEWEVVIDVVLCHYRCYLPIQCTSIIGVWGGLVGGDYARIWERRAITKTIETSI